MQRPVFFNLALIQYPVGAVTSIAHRISGILLACGIPLSIYLLDLSLGSPAGYDKVLAMLDTWILRVAGILFSWALGHHLLAGVRHLLSDVDIGSGLMQARRSAWLVNCLSPLFAIAAAWLLL